MTDASLLALYNERVMRLAATHCHPGTPLGKLLPEQRAYADHASLVFRVADLRITRELVRRGAPAELDGVTLWLTKDKAHWVHLRPGTKSVLGWNERQSRAAYANTVLLDY